MRALDELLPGLAAELVAAGVPSGDISQACSWTVGGVPLARGATGVPASAWPGRSWSTACASGSRRFRASPSVTASTSAACWPPTRDASPASRSSQPAVARRAAPRGPRRRRDRQGLQAAGLARRARLPAPAEEVVRCKMAYLTRRWQLPDASTYNDLVSVITPAENPHFGVMIAQEDGTHIVTLGGLLESGPARNDEDFLAFAASCRPRHRRRAERRDPVDRTRSRRTSRPADAAATTTGQTSRPGSSRWATRSPRSTRCTARA